MTLWSHFTVSTSSRMHVKPQHLLSLRAPPEEPQGHREGHSEGHREGHSEVMERSSGQTEADRRALMSVVCCLLYKAITQVCRYLTTSVWLSCLAAANCSVLPGWTSWRRNTCPCLSSCVRAWNSVTSSKWCRRGVPRPLHLQNTVLSRVFPSCTAHPQLPFLPGVEWLSGSSKD